MSRFSPRSNYEKSAGPLIPARKRRILFVCIGNAVRSQMAQAFAKKYGADLVEAESAGLAPAEAVAPLTLKVLRSWRPRRRPVSETSPRSVRTLRFRGQHQRPDSPRRLRARLSRMECRRPVPRAGIGLHRDGQPNRDSRHGAASRTSYPASFALNAPIRFPANHAVSGISSIEPATRPRDAAT